MLALYVGLLVLQFVVSAYGKILSLGKNQSEFLSNKLPIEIPDELSQLLVLSAGLTELVSLLLIMYGIRNDKKLYRDAGVIGLVVFTIVVTLVFGISPFQRIMVLKNISTVGGLLLLLSYVK